MQDLSIIEMSRRYPFDKQNVITPSIVKLRRRYKDHQYQELRKKIDIHSRLSNPHIINIRKGFQSKKSKYFDLFLEYVPSSLKTKIKSLSILDIWKIRQDLLNLCVFLLKRGIYPIITEDSLGIYEGKLKYYLDIDYSKVIGSIQELTKAKDLQISSIFNVYEQTIQNGTEKPVISYLLFKNKSQSTLKHMNQPISNLNSARYTIRSIENQKEHNQMISTQKNSINNKLQYYQTLPHFILQQQSIDLIKNNPYISNRNSLLPIFQRQCGIQGQEPSRQILCKSKDIKQTSQQVNEIIQEAIDNPSKIKHPYNQIIELQRCESQTKIEQLGSEHFQQIRQYRYQFHPSIKMTDSKSRKLSVDHNRQVSYTNTPVAALQRQQPKKKKQSLYHQAFGHKNDHLTKQFNTLFDNQSLLPSQSKDDDFQTSIKKDMHQQIRQIRQHNQQKIYELKKDKMNKQKFDMRQINNRVKKALQKSQQVLENFRGNIQSII